MLEYICTESGLKPANVVENVKNLEWGTIVVTKNSRLDYCALFFGDDQRVKILRERNREILHRSDVGNRYEVHMMYGFDNFAACERFKQWKPKRSI